MADGRMDETWTAFDPRSGEPLDARFRDALSEEVDAACAAAARAAPVLAAQSPKERAALLHACADAVEAAQEDLIASADAETALGRPRLLSEARRTVAQLRFFGDLAGTGELLDARIEREAKGAAAHPDMRSVRVPLGPVAVFGASNFPLAFSAAGNDMASALAAGCPVIVKGHPAHPETSERAARAIREAVEKAGLPAGVYAHLHGRTPAVGMRLVENPHIKAVGFTGSLQGGRALFDLAARRAEPIPVFAEMGSANPCLILPEALATRGAEIAKAFAAAGLQGMGQFCTSPGLLFAIEGEGLDAFREVATEAYAGAEREPMLTEGVHRNYRRARKARAAREGVHTLTPERVRTLAGFRASPALYEIDADGFQADASLSEEVFGPAALIIRCRTKDDMAACLEGLHGHLAASVFGTGEDLADAADLIGALQTRVGRIVFDGFATGVANTRATVHGGPYPATTAPATSSLGAMAAERFLRPVAWQNAPDAALPPALKDANPWGIERRVDGTATRAGL